MDSDTVNIVLDELEKYHGDAVCELDFGTPFELLVAVILSAQCTDKRVNVVTKELFKAANTPKAFASMDIGELEKIIYPCGFYKNKARNIVMCSTQILTDYGGEVPRELDELIKLAGVGRKTANVVYSVAFGGQAIAVDTHVFRVANRLGISHGKTPLDVENDLMAAIPKHRWSKSHHLFVHHGRYVCISRAPKCDICTVNEYCEYRKINR